MYDLEFACLEEPEPPADVDVYLWVSAGADGEAALELRIECVLLCQIGFDGIGLLERRIDKPQLRVTFMKVLLYTLKSEKTAKKAPRRF